MDLLDAQILIREFLKHQDPDIKHRIENNIRSQVLRILNSLYKIPLSIELDSFLPKQYNYLDQLQPNILKGVNDMLLGKESAEKIYHAYCVKFGDPKDKYWLSRFANQDKELPALELPKKEQKIFVCAILTVIHNEAKGKFNFDAYAKNRWGYNYSRNRGNYKKSNENERILEACIDEILPVVSEN